MTARVNGTRRPGGRSTTGGGQVSVQLLNRLDEESHYEVLMSGPVKVFSLRRRYNLTGIPHSFRCCFASRIVCSP